MGSLGWEKTVSGDRTGSGGWVEVDMLYVVSGYESFAKGDGGVENGSWDEGGV